MSSIRAREADVRESESRNRMSFQNSGIGIAHLDLAARYVQANKRMCDIVGYSAEELQGMPIGKISHPTMRWMKRRSPSCFHSGDCTFHLQSDTSTNQAKRSGLGRTDR